MRASSAAPTYFPPHSFEIEGKKVYFIDGGISSYNNPSLQLFIEATQEDYGLDWIKKGYELQVISIGTGFSTPVIYPPSKVGSLTFTQASWISYVIGSLMEDANLQQNILMKRLAQGNLRGEDFMQLLTTPANLSYYTDSKDLDSDLSTDKLFDYHRYTVSLEKQRLDKLLKKSLDDKTIADLQEMDCTDLIKLLSSIGIAVAKEQVKASHFSE